MSKLVFFLVFLTSAMFGQPPKITGDTILCPNSNGTAYILQAQMYDTYSWYVKFYGSDVFVLIEGQDIPSFTYDWYTYDQSIIKAVVTIGDDVYESNTLQIDSYAWVGMVVANEEGEQIQYDPESNSWSLCEGTTFDLEIFNPYSANIQWYKDGIAITDANEMIYTVAEAGTYYVIAAPPFCPDVTSMSLEFHVTINTECNLGVDGINQKAFAIHPNPARDVITITGTESIERVEIHAMTGQRIMVSDSNTLDVSGLSKGVYIVTIQSGENVSRQNLVRE